MTTKQMSNSTFIPEIIKILNEGHTAIIPLKGNSMRPFLQDGRDKAKLQVADTLTLKIGDVVLAELSPGRFVLHRIIALYNDDVTLLGDGNLSKEYCRRCDIKAKATIFYRKSNCRQDSVLGAKWKIYSSIWMNLYPIRRYLLYLLKIIGY